MVFNTNYQIKFIIKSIGFLLSITSLTISNTVLADVNLGLPALIMPSDNPQTREKITLGRILFNDKRFSADGSISCANCHSVNLTFTDSLPVAKGLNNQMGTRNTPSVINSAFYETLFWDGRANSLEQQALGPLLNPIEHGLNNYQVIIDIIRHDSRYAVLFNKAFAVQATAININHVAQALASYERTLIAGNSAFDRYLFGRDHQALSSSAERGLRLFKNKAHCVVCHEIAWNNALFTDNRFYNIGVGFKPMLPVVENLIAAIKQGKNPDALPLSAKQRSELGRFNVTKNVTDIGKFKTPTLRNIALTAPYMHNGSLNTLEAVVEHYDKAENNRFTDSKIFPLHLSKQEKADLVAFMQTLTSQSRPD